MDPLRSFKLCLIVPKDLMANKCQRNHPLHSQLWPSKFNSISNRTCWSPKKAQDKLLLPPLTLTYMVKIKYQSNNNSLGNLQSLKRRPTHQPIIKFQSHFTRTLLMQCRPPPLRETNLSVILALPRRPQDIYIPNKTTHLLRNDHLPEITTMTVLFCLRR